MINEKEACFANIVVDISHEKVDRPFQYRIPETLRGKLKPGMRVNIPFGSGNKLRTGYVIEVTGEAEFDTARLKEVDSVIDEEEDSQNRMIQLAAWMREQYGSTMIQALKTVLPARQKFQMKEKKEVIRKITPEEALQLAAECERKHQNAKARLLRELAGEEVLPYTLLSKKLNIAAATFESLKKAGALEISSVPYYRNPVKMEAGGGQRHCLSEGQQTIVRKITEDFDAGIRKTYLLHGITGSGKTEVYMELIGQILKRGKQAIVLIPEIALTYQTVMRFYKRFGDRVSVMNSTLSPGEKYDQCERAKKGEIDVIIGPRSALFTPFPNIGLIIIDEEHENSYKSESMPKYHARETAEKLAGLHGASVLLGSATPSMEAYYRAKKGEYGLFTLKERLTGGTLPEVYVEDLRKELKEGNRSIFARHLQKLMEDRLERKEQIMLFLNRRGYAGFVSCRSCGLVMKCPHCDVSLSEHRGGKLICHYCGYETPAVTLCPSCGSRYILGFRAGTQQIEEQLHRMYPKARVLRMDADTTRTKDSYEKILAAFFSGEADILVGTQMIVKGHDFPNVTLVGVLAADLSLAAGDYRAGERTFQLLTQAAGRAGRGKRPGEVVIQTYQPEHYSVVHASKQDYEGFFEEEMLYRELLAYPPAAHILAVQILAQTQERAEKIAADLAAFLRTMENREKTDSIVIGPAPASIGKINDIYRYGIYIKNKSYRILVKRKDQTEKFLNPSGKPGFDAKPADGYRGRELLTEAGLLRGKEMVQFDFDPVNPY